MRSAHLLSFATTALAQSATIVIEASHGGAGSDLTNTTITVPLSTAYTDPALDTVSTLFLTGASGVPVESLTCTPYRNTNGTGTGGLPFNSTSPSYLSTNTVQVGSIVCVSSTTGNGSATGTGGSGAPITTSGVPYANTTSSAPTSDVVSTVTNPTSTFVTTIPAASGSAAPQSTITSVVAGGSGSSTTTPGSGSASGTSSASASPSIGTNAGMRVELGDWVLQGMAVAGLGFAAMV